MSSLVVNKSYNAINVAFTNDKFVVFLEDGRELSVPLEWFPKLRNATKSELELWRLIGDGQGIHWELLDEDISVECLLKE